MRNLGLVLMALLISLLILGCAMCPVSKELKSGIRRQQVILENLKELSQYEPEPHEKDLYKKALEEGLDSAIIFNGALLRYLKVESTHGK